MKKPIALIDLDGTMADFHGAMTRDMDSLRCPYEPSSFGWDDNKFPPHVKARWDMIKNQPDWWFNLAPIAGGAVILGYLKQVGFKPHVLTRAPRKNFSAWEQKVRWCNKYLPGVDVTIGPVKSMVYGAILFDDWPEYIAPWLDHRPRGLVIMPDQPWNKDYSHPQIVRYTFGQNEAEVLSRIQDRYNELKEKK